jgi:predicted glycoside hydrolase/deacetylase ChbG (UPF0249 family)
LGYGFDEDAPVAELARLPAGLTELMVHPGHPDAALAAATRYVAGRERELRALTSRAARHAVRAGGIDLLAWAGAGG